MIYIELNKHQFADAFRNSNRKNNFSYDALCALYDHLNSLSYDRDIELDIIAICVDYTEHEPEDIISDYDYLVEDIEFDDEDEMLEAILDELRDRTTVLEVEGGTYILGEF